MLLKKLDMPGYPADVYEISDIRPEDIPPSRSNKKFMKVVRSLGKGFWFLNWFTMPEFDKVTRERFCAQSEIKNKSHKEVTSMYHIVEFHADGGQMCMPGRRSFDDPEKAKQFAERMRSEPGHNCGPTSVKEHTSKTDPGDEGAIYPEIANIGRH